MLIFRLTLHLQIAVTLPLYIIDSAGKLIFLYHVCDSIDILETIVSCKLSFSAKNFGHSQILYFTQNTNTGTNF